MNLSIQQLEEERQDKYTQYNPINSHTSTTVACDALWQDEVMKESNPSHPKDKIK